MRLDQLISKINARNPGVDGPAAAMFIDDEQRHVGYITQDVETAWLFPVLGGIIIGGLGTAVRNFWKCWCRSVPAGQPIVWRRRPSVEGSSRLGYRVSARYAVGKLPLAT